MPNALENLPHGSRVAVIRLRSLGDSVLTTPALEILKTSRPDLTIAVVVENRFRAVFEGNPDVSEILDPSVGRIARFRPDLCLNLHGGTRSIVLTAASAARIRAGFAHFRGGAVYNERIPRAQQILGIERTVHTAEHLVSAMYFLGAPRLPIPRAKLFAPRDPASTGSYAVIHPIASTPEKMWTPSGFVTVAEHLKGSGIEPIFIGGPADDLSAFSAFRTISGAALSSVKSILQDAVLFIGNDSGPAHMAAAFGLPVVVLFGDSDPVVWAPWRTPSEVLVNNDGIAHIPASQVIEAVEQLRVAR
jgi:ADP-heptose:LPS heptosyltransferase